VVGGGGGGGGPPGWGFEFKKKKNPFEFFLVTIEIGYNCKAPYKT
jgi:hypothetical protein